MAMGHRETLKSAVEVDAIRAAEHIRHRSGVRAYAKTAINRRVRLEAREQLRVMDRLEFRCNPPTRRA